MEVLLIGYGAVAAVSVPGLLRVFLDEPPHLAGVTLRVVLMGLFWPITAGVAAVVWSRESKLIYRPTWSQTT